ncbi:hypothetical protein [Bradyrhizobium sp. USDA 4508]
MSKLKVPGGYISNGQLYHAAHARKGAPKNIATPEIAHGQKRQTKGALHPWAHGQAVDDTVLEKKFRTGAPIPPHPDQMASRARARGDRGKPGDHAPELKRAANASTEYMTAHDMARRTRYSKDPQ